MLLHATTNPSLSKVTRTHPFPLKVTWAHPFPLKVTRRQPFPLKVTWTHPSPLVKVTWTHLFPLVKVTWPSSGRPYSFVVCPSTQGTKRTHVYLCQRVWAASTSARPAELIAENSSSCCIRLARVSCVFLVCMHVVHACCALCLFVCVCVCMCVCVYVYMRNCVCVCVCVHVHAYVCVLWGHVGVRL